ATETRAAMFIAVAAVALVAGGAEIRNVLGRLLHAFGEPQPPRGARAGAAAPIDAAARLARGVDGAAGAIRELHGGLLAWIPTQGLVPVDVDASNDSAPVRALPQDYAYVEEVRRRRERGPASFKVLGH